MSWTVVGLILIMVMFIAGSKVARCSFLLFAGIAAIFALVWWIAAHHGSGPPHKLSELTFQRYPIIAIAILFPLRTDEERLALPTAGNVAPENQPLARLERNLCDVVGLGCFPVQRS